MSSLHQLKILCTNHDIYHFKELFETNNFYSDEERDSLIWNAIKVRNMKILFYLLERGFGISNEQIVQTVYFPHMKIPKIKFLLEREIDSESRSIIISYYVMRGNDEIVEILLRQGADANELMNDRVSHSRFSGNRRLINVAVYFKYISVCKILLSNGANPSLDNSYCLSLAIRLANEEIIKLLLSYGADPSVITKDDIGDLIKSKPSLSLINFLVEYGLDLSMINTLKFTPSTTDEAFARLLGLGIDPAILIRLCGN